METLAALLPLAIALGILYIVGTLLWGARKVEKKVNKEDEGDE